MTSLKMLKNCYISLSSEIGGRTLIVAWALIVVNKVPLIVPYCVKLVSAEKCMCLMHTPRFLGAKKLRDLLIFLPKVSFKLA